MRLTFGLIGLISLLSLGACGSAPKAKKMNQNVASMSKEASKESLDEKIANWPARPKLAIQQMMGKYGPPNEVSSETVVWHDQGPFKRIMVTRKEIPHDFPLPHMDFLEHTVSYNVPSDKADELLAFDGSITIMRTAGELSARCDLEGHNILTLNLAHDIIRDNKTVATARKEFGQYTTMDYAGEHPAYVEKLLFQPLTMNKAAFSDTPVIPGSPVRSMEEKDGRQAQQSGDAEVLSFVIAADTNEILASKVAEKKKISKEVLDYSKMLHKEHGKNQKMTMMVGKRIGITPMDTKEVDALKVKGASELSMLVPLDGKEFEKAYMAAMIKNHQEVLAMIDNQLMPQASEKALKDHLKMTRDHVAMHLDKAKEIEKKI
jgi:predicted outer membrane protein